MGVNAAQFERELLGEVEDVSKEFVAFRADIVGDILSVAAKRTPAGATKKTVRSWGASVGSLRWHEFKGSAKARFDIRRSKPGSFIYFGNSHFVSGFWEKGTGTRFTKKSKAHRGRIRARHMLKVGIESVRGRKR